MNEFGVESLCYRNFTKMKLCFTMLSQPGWFSKAEPDSDGKV